jgi:hypothetical protein
MPLRSFETEHTALVKWPANEVFQPHLSQHHPFVNDPTVILVKTGHLPTA